MHIVLKQSQRNVFRTINSLNTDFIEHLLSLFKGKINGYLACWLFCTAVRKIKPKPATAIKSPKVPVFFPPQPRALSFFNSYLQKRLCQCKCSGYICGRQTEA
jgi:hypothetical protein